MAHGIHIFGAARTHSPPWREPWKEHQPLGLQPKRECQAGFIAAIALVLELLNGIHRHARLAGQLFAAPTQHGARLYAVFGGELMQDDLLFYERAHCQRGNGVSPGSTGEGKLYCVFVQLF